MSGGGGGGYFSFDQTVDCKSLAINTNLASPDPVVVATLAVGDELAVEFVPPTGPLRAVTAIGDVAGVLLPADIVQLIDCISKGIRYKARVISITGGNCQVLITTR